MSSTESASAVYGVAIIGAGGLCAYEFPTFEHAKMLSVRVMRGDWPAQRSCAAYDMSPGTPLANLWNVGEAVKDYGDCGTQACAFTARVASERVLSLLRGAPA